MILAKTDLSPRSVYYARSVLSRAFNRAIRWQLLIHNVAALAECPIQPLTLEQAKQLLATVKTHRLSALYVIALSLGLRRGEALALLWNNCDFERAVISIEASLQWENGKLVRSKIKTSSSRRTLPLTQSVVTLLQNHRTQLEVEKQRYSTQWQEHGYVFPCNLVTSFKRLLKRAGLSSSTRWHDLRHSCATFLIAQNVHLRVIM